MPGVIIDIGTGDGSFVYELAKKYPDRMIIGIDPNQSALIDVSRKIIKKPAKGGVKNAMFVLANATDLPDELADTANQVFINLPWGSLLTGIVRGEKEIFENIKKICQKGAIVDILFGYDKNLEIKEIGELPDISIEYIKNILAPKVEKFGFKLIKAQTLNSAVLKTYPSKWAKKLSFATPRDFYYIRLKI
jgi:16S rRNA (adenine(1408)-N(1))-methyltransferase